MKKITKKIIIPTLIMLLSGCSLAPDYQRPNIETPAAFSSGTAAETDIAKDWWKNFGSEELNNLMTEGLANNNDIRAAQQRVEQARAAVKIAGASLLPAANVSANASRNRSNPVTGATDTSTNIGTGAGVSYELDLFGSNRNSRAAAAAGLAGSQFDKQALDLVVMGSIAQTYFTLINTRERLEVADKNIANAKEILRIVQARFDAGSASGLDLAQQKSSVASADAARAAISQNLKTSENALAVLLGKAPQEIAKANSLDGLTVPAVAPGQPSELLERRPDIRSSEQNLIAANADIGVARAAFFPTVTLGLNASVAMAGLGDPVSSGIGFVTNLAAPIFSGGRLEGGVEQANARQKELVENYRKTVLTSFQEVEDALAAVKAAELREQSFSTARDEAERAYQLTRELFDKGSVDFQTVIDVQGNLLQAEDSFTQSRNARLLAAIQLYQALGGGWK